MFGAYLKKRLVCKHCSTGTDYVTLYHSEYNDFCPIFCFHARFTAVAQTDLKEPLKVLGITEMFDSSKANFTKITSMFI